MLKTPELSELEIEMLTIFAADNPKLFRFVGGVEGLCTCSGYAMEMLDEDGNFKGVMHPKAFIDLLFETA